MFEVNPKQVYTLYVAMKGAYKAGKVSLSEYCSNLRSLVQKLKSVEMMPATKSVSFTRLINSSYAFNVFRLIKSELKRLKR